MLYVSCNTVSVVLITTLLGITNTGLVKYVTLAPSSSSLSRSYHFLNTTAKVILRDPNFDTILSFVELLSFSFRIAHFTVTYAYMGNTVNSLLRKIKRSSGRKTLFVCHFISKRGEEGRVCRTTEQCKHM